MTKNYKPLTIKQALQLASPRSWVAAICPALFGILYCRIQGYPLNVLLYLPLLLACVLLQSSVNTLNDYMDFIKGTDDEDDFLEENDAVLIYGGIHPKSALILGTAFLLAGLLFGLIACIGHGFTPILIGMVGAGVVVLYSCGPQPISYLPIGELTSGFVMGGLIPLGICACADGRIHWGALLAAAPLILGIAMIMLCNNSCDIEKDIEAGRKTFPCVIGREKALLLYRIAILLWLTLLVTFSLLLIGKIGLGIIFLLILLARKPFWKLWQLKLEPQSRIQQMKTIAAANLTGNGSYCLILLLACLISMIEK